MFLLFATSCITTMTLFINHIIPPRQPWLYMPLVLPAAMMIAYTVILRMKGMTPNDTVCTSGEGIRIDMTRTNMNNPATAPVGFSEVGMVSNFNTVLLSSAPLASAPAAEVPWYAKPTDMNDHGTKSANMPPPPAYGN